MDEVWTPLKDFPNYVISDTGLVVNTQTGNTLTVHKNQSHVCYVKLSNKAGKAVRSLALLVAQTYLPEPRLETFNTPMHLDGNRQNNHASNLVWRPLWFVRMFITESRRDWEYSEAPIKHIESGAVFPTIRDVCKQFGILELHLIPSLNEETAVWPDNQHFMREVY